ncbi:MAG: sn-glycerol-3-phosphate ABC transporter ATP-binding protein UgpC [Rhodobacteraceae bacterium]|nr:sn-glycerol-3-phosphate ABC transporter ATP-binding protein UgpC [Paracoccaceae bacterium]
MADITLSKISKSYGAVNILHELDLTVKDGEFLILVGESGCGKSTTLRIIAGLETPSSGSLSIGGREVTNLPPGDRNCAMVFQSYALYPHMNVRDNIGFGLRLRGQDKATRDAAAAKAAETLSLSHLLDRLPRDLSGGQRQRVAIGRAIVRRPDAFLFDEPLSNLDAKLRIEMRSEIKELHQKLGATMVYVTHDQVEAMTMADRVVVMDRGRVSQIAPPITLYQRPANLFVAGFIGAPSMNLVPVTAEAGGTIRFANGAVLGGGRQDLAPGRKLILGIRPEHLTRGQGGLDLRVRTVEPLGALTHIHADLGGQMITAQLRADDAVTHDDQITLLPDLSQSHWFDPDTQLRLADSV